MPAMPRARPGRAATRARDWWRSMSSVLAGLVAVWGLGCAGAVLLGLVGHVEKGEGDCLELRIFFARVFKFYKPGREFGAVAGDVSKTDAKNVFNTFAQLRGKCFDGAVIEFGKPGGAAPDGGGKVPLR